MFNMIGIGVCVCASLFDNVLMMICIVCSLFDDGIDIDGLLSSVFVIEMGSFMWYVFVFVVFTVCGC